ncbi:MAG: ThuA domain-containing protein [Tepidisphaeraceae bacterium]
MAKKALIVWGGWDGHQPKQVADIFERVLKEEGFSVTVSDTLAAFDEGDKLADLNLIVPVWTMGKITNDQLKHVTTAVSNGVGLAGCHGGMCDSFREATEWQWMTGGQWVAHPGNDGVNYTVNIIQGSDPIVAGIADFPIASEQYLMHVDPSNKVLATTDFPVAPGPHSPNGPFKMPVVWTRYHGKGKVFYNALGHHADIVAAEPNLTLMRRGFNWAVK